jgi:hypothetical protein
MVGEIENARITCFDHGILRESRLFPIDPIVSEKTNGHQCRRSVGADRSRDHECPMMEITHPCAAIGRLRFTDQDNETITITITITTKTNNELTRDDLHANVFNHLKGEQNDLIFEI